MTALSMARPTRSVRFVLIAVAAGLLGAVNLYLAARSIGLVASGAPAVDWEQYVEASRRVATGGDLYAVTDTYAYHYSPLLAALFGLLAPLGTLGWRALHVVAALALPSWPMRVIALLSWPFWYDVETGNVMIFVVLAGAWALAGSRWAAGIFFVLAILIPRPLMLPLVAWLLWRQPEWRVPVVAAFALHALAVVALGWGGEWLSALVAAGGDVAIPSNVGPSRFIGTLPWVLIGLPLAAFLTWKGRIGFASLAASPYWLPYYLLMPLLELVRWRPGPASR
jgi:hypothetical protein